jgi:Zn-finger nucleic acid-binding protein
MKCPNCNETLLMTERHSVEIDYCPNCRGVWLDKGELDKLLDFASEQKGASEPYDQKQPQTGLDQFGNRYNDYKEDKSKYGQQPYRKKKSFLSDFFDFD